MRAEPARKPPSAPGRLRRRRKQQRPAPTTRLGVILGGVGRFLLVLATLSTLISLAALLLIWLAGTDPKRAFMIMFFLGGAVLAGGGVAASADLGGSDYYWDQQEKEQRVSYSFVFVAVGLPLIAVGLLLEAL